MNPLRTVQALQAAAGGRAVPAATRRHVHLSPRPLVLLGYHLAGDLGAPLALMWGANAEDEPRCLVVPEPRNRRLRFEALDQFGAEFLAYLAEFEARDELGECLDAPQLVVPNTATADWLGRIVGRFTRSLKTEGEVPAPPSVPLVGKHLSFFGDLVPGSSLVLAATRELATHWQSGQLQSEDLNLAAQLGWIDPAEGMDGPEAARAGEQAPPAGPDSDPNWDDDTLTELVGDWHAREDDASRATVGRELEREIREQLSPAWADCWRALGLLDSLPAAEHVESRWASDRYAWSRHSDRVSRGEAFFRNIPKPTQSAKRLAALEKRTDELEREMAWDDPLVMAAVVASGEALAGRVVAIDPERRTKSAGSRAVRRPLITIEPDVEFGRPAGTRLFLSTDPRVRLEVQPLEAGGPIRAEVIGGANTAPTIERLPDSGEAVILSPFGKPDFFPRPEVDEIPWTHQQVLEEDDEATR